MQKNPSFLIFVFLLCARLSAQTVSISDGVWSTVSNWSSGIPLSYATATIEHDMTLDVTITIGNGGEHYINGSITDPIGGTAYDIDINGSGIIEVNGNVSIEGSLEVNNSGSVTVKSNDTLRVRGDANFEQSSTLVVEEGGVLIVEGDMELRNSNASVVNGKVSVGGNLTSRNTATLTGNGNVEVDGEIDIRNSSSVFGSTTDCSPGPCEYGSGEGLPIKLVSFNGTVLTNGNVLLKWETGSEVNNDYFLIEMSESNNEFKPLKKVTGAGNSNQNLNYEIVISTNSEKFPLYFRLTQFDFDGKSEQFNPIAIYLTNKRAIEDFYVFPNPGNGERLALKIKGLPSGNYNLSLSKLTGQQLIEDQFYHERNASYQIDLLKGLQLKPGIYTIHLQGEDESYFEKVIVN